ncbi:MAG: (2Fe-2S)-binding protein [Deltaproteobacteria bacterium]|nr:(2Fe-2S)-binding protein [Deltaproteobacteria bacterium]
MSYKDKKEKLRISRRAFLRTMGIGAATSTAVATGVVKAPFAESAVPPKVEGLDYVPVELKVNGRRYTLTIESRQSLADVLRNELELTGTKIGCNQGECGACTVIIDGRAMYSCLLLSVNVQGKNIETIEGLSRGGRLHPLQSAFIEKDAYQCGWCTPGQIMASKALPDKNKNPSFAEVKTAVSGNICRCAAYNHIFDAVLSAAKKL